MTLELTIRPFQSPDVTPPRVVPEGTKRDEPVNVSLGKEGGKTFDFSYSFSGQSRSSSDNYKEVARKSETRRIENPNDPDQFVGQMAVCLEERAGTNAVLCPLCLVDQVIGA